MPDLDNDLRVATLTGEESIKFVIDGRRIDHVDLLTDSSVKLAFTDDTSLVIDSASWSAVTFIQTGIAVVPAGWEPGSNMPPLSDVRIRRRRFPGAGFDGEFEEVDILGRWDLMEVRIAQFRATCSIGRLELTATFSNKTV
nr:MAG TPA: hypothetical protein [Caudoviricetes sp.]